MPSVVPADRLNHEQAFHDAQARERADTFAAAPVALRVDDNVYLDHETWIRPAMGRLQPLAGKRILDFGCGHGMASVVMARRGANVTAFDLSRGYLSEVRQRASVNGVSLDLVQADGERLPFADASFDGVWGNAILHHLDLSKAAAELRRVLRPGGIAVFCEPWGDNPVLRLARRRLWYPGKERTVDEEPLRSRDLAALRAVFPRMTVEGHQLLGMVRRLWPRSRLVSLLHRCDGGLLRAWPSLQRWCRYVVLMLPR